MRGKQIFKKLLVSLLSLAMVFTVMPEVAHAGGAELPKATITGVSYDATTATLSADFNWSQSRKPSDIVELIVASKDFTDKNFGHVEFYGETYNVFGLGSTDCSDNHYSGSVVATSSGFTATNTLVWPDGVSQGPQVGDSMIVTLQIYDSTGLTEMSDPWTITVGDPTSAKPLKGSSTPSCDHAKSKRKYTSIDDQTHDVDCSCGYSIGIYPHSFAKEKLPLNSKFPYGGIREYCKDCNWEKITPNVPNLTDLGDSAVTAKWDTTTTDFVGGDTFTLTGESVEPKIAELSVVVPDENSKAVSVTVPESQFTVSYENNKAVGEGLVVIKGDETHIKGEIKKKFKIVKEEDCKHPNMWTETHMMVEDTSDEYPFGFILKTCPDCGFEEKTALVPDLSALSKADNLDVSLKEDQEGYDPETDSFKATGEEIKPEIGEISFTLKDKDDKDFKVDIPLDAISIEYKNNVDPGEALIKLIGVEEKGVTGEAEKPFNIKKEKEDSECEHDWEVEVLIKATCTRGATVNIKCKICGEKAEYVNFNITEDQEKYPDLAKTYGAPGHDYTGPIKYFIRSTVKSEDEGQHGPTCTRCGLVDDKNLQPHSFTLHTVQNGVCGDPDQPVIIEGECACGAKLHAESSREHLWVADNSKDIQPTCTEPGKINGERCMFCGTFGNYDFVEALGHDKIVDKHVDATCLADGYEDSHCSRCSATWHEDYACLSPTRNHVFEPVPGLQATCEDIGTYGTEKCKYCSATQDGKDYGIIPALGHKKHTVGISTVGRTRDKVDPNGKNMEITAYVAIYDCERCGKLLGCSYYTVAKQIGRFPMYKIVPGKNVEITDMKNGVHVKDNMSDDGGVYFNGEIRKSLKDAVENDDIQEYKKYETHSYVVEFTDAFLVKQADGWYDLTIVNGDVLTPMMVKVQDHKFVDLAELNVINYDDETYLSGAEFDALLKRLDEFCANVSAGKSGFDETVVNRLFDQRTGRHLFTSNFLEYTNLVVKGWKAEGTAFTAGKTGAPVFRLYNAETTDHFYTADVKERDALAGNGWTVEGIAFTVDGSFKRPVYRLVNPKVKKGAYLLTADKSEADKLVAEGWTNEGIAFMVR